jgi:GMP synthase-like glutamine amidotransferase
MNRDVVQQSPAAVEQIAWRAVNPNHGMYSPKKVLTVQGHPEFNPEIEGELLKMRLEQGIIPQDKYDDAMTRLNNPTDGDVVARAILKFYSE